MKPLRIGIDARTLYSPAMKGIGVYLQNLLNEMLRLEPSAEFFLYFDSRQKTLNRRPDSRQVTERPVQIGTGDRFYFWEQWALPEALKRDRISLLHSPANTLPLTFAGPKVVTVHDTTIQEREDKTRIDMFYYNFFQPYAIRRANRVLTVSEFSKSNIEKRLGVDKRKIRVIPNGISPAFRLLADEKTVEATKARLGIHGNYIFNAGGESPWKNVARLIEAYAALECPEDLVITGVRSEKVRAGHLEKIRELGLTGRVHLLTYVSEADLIALYNGASVFIYPSLLEGFGFPPLEAMACGIPVAASNAASIPEVTGNAALSFDANRTADIAAALRRLLTDEALRLDLRKRGFDRVRQFTWEQNARLTLEVYREVLNGK